MSDRPSDIEAVFLAALERSTPADRAAYLDRACAADLEMKSQVEALLRAHEDAGSFLENPPAGLAATAATRDGSELSGSSSDFEESGFDFLEPCDKPDRLGRLGHYEIMELVGRGGMGIVLKGHDPKLNRVVAIKVLAPELAAIATARRRFLREAQAAAAVSHDHVVTIHAIDDAARLPFLVMEYIAGQSLQQRIDRSGPLKLAEILRIGKQIAAGLAAAHAEGLIHRDVKPANILLENGVERVKITDFGLARAVDEARVTKTGVVAGTPEYMSPEQAQGLAVDYRSDLFSLGCVLYAMCTGRPPFRGDTTIAVIRRVCDDTPRPVREVNPEIPEWLAAIIDRLLAKNPGERLESAREVSELLGQHLAHLQQPSAVLRPASLAPMVDASERQQQGTRGRWAAACLAVLVGLALLMLTESTGLTRFGSAVMNKFGSRPDRETTVPVNHGLRFNGRDHYVFTPVKIETGHSLTVEAFVIPESDNPLNVPRIPHMKKACSTILADTAGSGMGLFITATGVLFTVHAGDRYVFARSTQFPFRGERFHVAGVFDGKAIRLFLNGTLSAESPFTGEYKPSPLNVMIGANPKDGTVKSDEFRGVVDEVRISKIVRYLHDFVPEERFEPDDDTLALYHFDEGEGGIAHDSSANHFDGQIEGAEWAGMDSLPRGASLATAGATSQAPKGAVDLLRLIEPKRDTLRGHCWLEGKRLVLPSSGKKLSHLAIPYLPPDQYEIRVRVQRLSGYQGFGISFDLGGSRLWAMIDNMESNQMSISGFRVWNGREFKTLGNGSREMLLPCGEDALIRCGVVREGGRRKVYLKCNDVDVSDWQGVPQRPAVHDVFSPADNRAVSLAAFWDTFLIESVELVPLSGEGQALSFTNASAPREKQVAESVLWQGGTVRVSVDADPNLEIDEIGKLPPSFVLKEIDLRKCKRFSGGELPDLTGLGRLDHLILRGQKNLPGAELQRLVTSCSAREIDLANTSVMDEQLRSAGTLPDLESLDLSLTAITEGGLASMEAHRSLRRLILSGTQITDAGLQHIAALTQLEELDLSGTKISGDELQELSRLKKLKRLLLDLTAVDNADLAHLRNLPDLTYLSLANTRVSNAGLAGLDGLENLTEICLVGTQVTAEGVEAFAKKLPGCQVEYDGDAPVDLLALFNRDRKANTGNWTFNQGALISPQAEEWPRVKIPFTPPEEYVLEVAASRESETDGGLFLGLVAGGQRFSVAINTILGGGLVSGLEMVDRRRVDFNETTFIGNPVKDPKAFTILAVVRQSQITVSIDDRLIVDWRGDPSRLAPYHWHGDFDENVLGLSSYNSVYRITRMQLTPISSTKPNGP